jgi:hypothetical protein
MTPASVAQLIDDLIALFDPVVQAVEDVDNAEALLKDMGYHAPISTAFLNDFSSALGALLEVADQADALLRDDGEPDYLALFGSLITAIQDIVKLIRDIGGTLQTNFPADFLAATNMVEQFPRQLADYLMVRMIERQYPVLHSALLVLGIIKQDDITTSATPFNKPYMQRVIRWEKLGDYFDHPLPSIQEAYGWNTDNFDYDGLIRNVHRFGRTIRLFSSPGNPVPATLQALNGGTDVITDDNAGALNILRFPLLPVLNASIGAEIYPVLNAACSIDGQARAGRWLEAQIHLQRTQIAVVVRRERQRHGCADVLDNDRQGTDFARNVGAQGQRNAAVRGFEGDGDGLQGHRPNGDVCRKLDRQIDVAAEIQAGLAGEAHGEIEIQRHRFGGENGLQEFVTLAGAERKSGPAQIGLQVETARLRQGAAAKGPGGEFKFGTERALKQQRLLIGVGIGELGNERTKVCLWTGSAKDIADQMEGLAWQNDDTGIEGRCAGVFDAERKRAREGECQPPKDKPIGLGNPGGGWNLGWTPPTATRKLFCPAQATRKAMPP